MGRSREEGALVEMDLTLNMHVVEDDTNTMVHAVLNLRGDHFEATGNARRKQIDPPMPVIGEELAVARALQKLASDVMEAAHAKIEQFLVPS